MGQRRSTAIDMARSLTSLGLRPRGHTKHQHFSQAPHLIGRAGRHRGRPLLPLNWLQVLGTTELSQINQRVRHQLHAIVPLLDAFKSQKQPLELIFPRKGPLDTRS